MRETIINVLIFILFFNLLLIIFPEGKTQKYCKLVLKLFLFIYIINSMVFKGMVCLDDLIDFKIMNENASGYEREISLMESENDFIKLINEDLCNGEEVIKNIKVGFSKDMDVNITVILKRSLSFEEQDKLEVNIANIFNIDVNNVKITF